MKEKFNTSQQNLLKVLQIDSLELKSTFKNEARQLTLQALTTPNLSSMLVDDIQFQLPDHVRWLVKENAQQPLLESDLIITPSLSVLAAPEQKRILWSILQAIADSE